MLWWAACLICGGLVGLVLAAVGTLRGRVPSRFRLGVVAVGAAAQLAGAGSFAVVGAVADFRPCAVRTVQPPGDAYGTAAVSGGGLWEATRTVVAAPVSGAALLYGVGKGGELYRCDNGTTAMVLDDGVVRAGTMFGTVFLTDQRMEADTPRMRSLAEHEARHTDQWAAFSLAAGPAAFPALYALDEALFPGAFNHFERQAGLEAGGYDPPSDCPSIAGRLTLLSLGLLAGSVLVVRHRLRRPSASKRSGKAVPQR
ncbi:hypothetical protein GCM10010251_67640 [Streptomyces aurantiogriseus]|uniref:Uncharacterized protein n=1 Tax=Streptomyces aurantiogriseus TaxID=66870 RepID=A0A918FIY2_9ACTN|nr:hypothetical protein GCM10010251_67640 [Streptomyces aurantiogriseus]